MAGGGQAAVPSNLMARGAPGGAGAKVRQPHRPQRTAKLLEQLPPCPPLAGGA